MLNSHLLRNGLNIPNQSAYKKNNSTETVLIRLTNDLLIASEEKSATVVMLLDLSAAFDLVDHGLLLNILSREIGLRGVALKWFKSFLSGRTQRVRLKDTLSDSIVIKFGVPQGSVLGPVLFNIYIRSIYRTVQNLGFNIWGYADDHQVAKSFKPDQQFDVLHHDIIKCFKVIKQWMASYYMLMNDSKTQFIVFGPQKILNELQIHGVNLGPNTSIRFVSSVKNLGIYMDSSLTMERQIVELKKKCFRTIRNICKIRFYLTEEQLKKVVNSLVVSCLDYCNSLYYGISNKLSHQLQLIQNACAKAITGKYKYDHLGNDLSDLHWLNIKKRVLFKIGLISYKSINGHAPDYLQELFRYAHHGHNIKLIVPNLSLERYGRRSLSYIGPKFINSLPEYVVAAPTVESFKSNLKTFLFSLSDHEISNLC